MQKIEAQYEIVTPMFIGGGDKQEEPEVRSPSIKGVLRFWWRALQWGDCLKMTDNNSEHALHELYKQEAELFGAAFKHNKYGQGLCTLKLKNVKTSGVEQSWPSNNDEPHRKGINQGQFTVCLMLKEKTSKKQVEQLKKTLLIWGLLGALGSRARRGFGSIAIKQLEGQSFVFNDVDEYYAEIKTILNDSVLAPEMPIFTALNEAMQIARFGQGNDARKLMNRLGSQYKDARKDAGAGMAKLPFGLPLAGSRGTSDENNRRSSPLFMHIHTIGKQYVAIVSFIPAVFHPEYPLGEKLDFYKTVQDYMNTMERVYP